MNELKQVANPGKRRWLRRLVVVSLAAVLLSTRFVFLRGFPARQVDLKSPGPRSDIEKWVGVVPQSGIAYHYASGFLDPTLFYKLRVTPEEATTIIRYGFEPASPYQTPWTAPYWWHPRPGPSTKYFATVSNFPNRCIYEPDSGWIYLEIAL